MRTLKVLLVFLISTIFLQYSKIYGLTEEKTSFESTSAEKSLVELDNRFELKVLKGIVKKEKNKNVFVSPLKIVKEIHKR